MGGGGGSFCLFFHLVEMGQNKDLAVLSFSLNFLYYFTLGPSSIKTREVLGNLEGRGDGFPNNSRVLVEDGHSLIINFSTGSGSGNPSFWAGEGLTGLRLILPC